MREQTLVTTSGRFHCLAIEPDLPREVKGSDHSSDPDTPDTTSTVLYLHGFPDHPPTAVPMLLELARAGYRVFAPWLRGYHPSVLDGPYSTDRLVQDVLDLAQLVSAGRPVHLLGHDWGAVIAYPALARAPELFASAVTLAVPHPAALTRAFGRSLTQLRMSWYAFFFQLPWLPERAVRALDMALIDRLWRSWSPGYTLPKPERLALHRCLRASQRAPIDYYRAALRPGPMRRTRLERVSVPTLHLHGERDGCIHPASARDQERFFAGPFESRVVPGRGHFLPQEDPRFVAERAHAWFSIHRGV